MSSNNSSNSKVLRNTLFLYLRMFISLFVSLFTGGVVLRTLGVEDYGINALVGSVISMFGIVQTSMIGATSRFITFEMGRGDKQRLSDTFSTALTIHIIIAFILFLILETVGLWMVNLKLVIPESRMFAANCIYQFSIFSMMLGVTQTPYGAALVANERFGVYAYFDILGILLKLLILFVLLIGNVDKLILYGILTFCVSTLMRTIYRVYCVRHFPETHYHFVWKKELIKPMLSFSGWDVFGNVAVMARGQGVAMLLNLFFGPVMNAAAGIAATVQSAISGFSGNIIMAARPQLIKRYANGEYESMQTLMSESIRFSFILIAMITIPLCCEMQFVLARWLGVVPEYACIFTILTLVFNIVGCIAGVVMIIVHATGRIKKTSIGNSFLYIMVIPVTYIAFKLGAPAWVPFLYNAVAFFCGMLWNTYLMSSYIRPLSFKRFLFDDVLRCFLMYTIVTSIVLIPRNLLSEGWGRLFVSIITSILLTSVCSYFWLLTDEMKNKMVLKFREKFSAHKRIVDKFQ